MKREHDLLRDRDSATRILDPSDHRFVTGSEQDRANARAQWHKERFIHSVMSRHDLEEIPRSRLQPLRGMRLVEDTASGTFYRPRLDGIIDLDYVPAAVAYYVDASGFTEAVARERLDALHPQRREGGRIERMTGDVISAIKSELHRIGATRPQVPDAQVIGVSDEGAGYATLGGSAVSFPFKWYGRADEILQRLEGLPDESGPEAIRSEFGA